MSATEQTVTAAPIVEMRKISKLYRGVPAVKEVDFDLRKGEIHALLGENGAGKSTLTKVMAGVVTATGGTMTWHGKEVSFQSPFEALEAGIAMVFQETSLVPSMTVAQNLYLGTEKFLNRLRGIYISAQQFLQCLGKPGHGIAKAFLHDAVQFRNCRQMQPAAKRLIERNHALLRLAYQIRQAGQKIRQFLQ